MSLRVLCYWIQLVNKVLQCVKHYYFKEIYLGAHVLIILCRHLLIHFYFCFKTYCSLVLVNMYFNNVWNYFSSFFLLSLMPLVLLVWGTLLPLKSKLLLTARNNGISHVRRQILIFGTLKIFQYLLANIKWDYKIKYIVTESYQSCMSNSEFIYLKKDRNLLSPSYTMCTIFCNIWR